MAEPDQCPSLALQPWFQDRLRADPNKHLHLQPVAAACPGYWPGLEVGSQFWGAAPNQTKN